MMAPPSAIWRAAWRQAVRDSHPDRMIARGVPEEGVRLAEDLIATGQAAEKLKAFIDFTRLMAEEGA